jgi:hypothetical protein
LTGGITSRKPRVHPRRRCVDPKTQRCHDALDHVENRLLPLKQTAHHPLDPPSRLLVRTPEEGGLLDAREPPPTASPAVKFDEVEARTAPAGLAFG